MSSIHERLCAAAMAAAMLTGLGGCVFVTSEQPDALSLEPLLVDEAMQQRDWEPVTVEFPSGAVVAGSVPIPFLGPRIYRGSHYPPSHTFQPPLPEEPQPVVEPTWAGDELLFEDVEVIPDPPAEDPGPPPAPGVEEPAPLVPPAPQPVPPEDRVPPEAQEMQAQEMREPAEDIPPPANRAPRRQPAEVVDPRDEPPVQAEEPQVTDRPLVAPPDEPDVASPPAGPGAPAEAPVDPPRD